MLSHLFLSSILLVSVHAQCPDYTNYSEEYHGPFSGGVYNLSYQRPAPFCRTFSLPEVEATIANITAQIADPDLSRLFENAFPNTLDTTVRWKGDSNTTGEELTFVITGDIDAMWLRDSANQMQSYLSLLSPSDSPNSLASLYRGVINLQARYLLTSPFCQAFQPPVESGLPPSVNTAADDDTVYPDYSNTSVFECKYELDSLAAFLQISADYYTATNDSAFFGRYSWAAAVDTILNVATQMQTPTYSPDDLVFANPYTFTRLTTSGEDTLDNSGAGNPAQNATGLIRSAFRPSDDATIFQFLIPSNAQFSADLAAAAAVAAAIGNGSLADEMLTLSASVRAAVEAHAVVTRADGTQSYAYEVDGYGSANLMDDANIPSLLSLPLLNYTPATAPLYTATRARLLSPANPYYAAGPVLAGVGGPHDGPGHVWPMSVIVRLLTSDDEAEVHEALRMLLSSTDGLGLVHESVWAWDASVWTRQWFAWANGLFGMAVLELSVRMPGVLAASYQ